MRKPGSVYDPDEELDALRAEDSLRKRAQAQLLANPLCADPDHPGCLDCEPGSED